MKKTMLGAVLLCALAPSLTLAASTEPKPPKVPALPAVGYYDEKPSDDVLQVCNTHITNGDSVTVEGISVPTFNVTINEGEEGTANLRCTPRVVIGTRKVKDGNQTYNQEYLKTISPKAVCTFNDGEGEGLVEVGFNASGMTYGGLFTELRDGAAIGMTESFKSTFKVHKGSCPQQQAQ